VALDPAVGRHWRWASRAEKAVGECPLYLQQPSHDERSPGHRDWKGAQIGEAKRQTHDEERESPCRPGEPASKRERSRIELESAHQPPVTLTLPLFESAWIAHGAPSSLLTPSTLVAPPFESA